MRLRADLGSVLLVAVCIGVFGLFGFGVYQSVAQGSETHRALCQFKAGYQETYDNSQEFLDMTLTERIEKYGDVLGRIPDSTVRTSQAQASARLDSLRFLDCA